MLHYAIFLNCTYWSYFIFRSWLGILYQFIKEYNKQIIIILRLCQNCSYSKRDASHIMIQYHYGKLYLNNEILGKADQTSRLSYCRTLWSPISTSLNYQTLLTVWAKATQILRKVDMIILYEITLIFSYYFHYDATSQYDSKFNRDQCQIKLNLLITNP